MVQQHGQQEERVVDPFERESQQGRQQREATHCDDRRMTERGPACQSKQQPRSSRAVAPYDQLVLSAYLRRVLTLSRCKCSRPVCSSEAGRGRRDLRQLPDGGVNDVAVGTEPDRLFNRVFRCTGIGNTPHVGLGTLEELPIHVGFHISVIRHLIGEVSK